MKKSSKFSPEVRERAVRGQRVFRPGGARPPHQVLKTFVDQHRKRFGVESFATV